MARYQYVILSRAVEGRENDYDTWYDTQHLGDVARIPGVVSAKRFPIAWQKTTDLDVPQWRSVAIYEIEADDPQAVVAAISAASGTEAMPFSDAMTKSGLVQLLVSAPQKLPRRARIGLFSLEKRYKALVAWSSLP